MSIKFSSSWRTVKRITALVLACILLSLTGCDLIFDDDGWRNESYEKRESDSKKDSESESESSDESYDEEESEDSFLEEESAAESEDSMDESSNESESEEESEPEPEPSWTIGLPAKKDVSEAVISHLPTNRSLCEMDYWHTTLMVSTRHYVYDDVTPMGRFDSMDVLLMDAATSVYHLTRINKPVSNIQFLGNGYVFYYYLEDEHIQIVILNQDLQEDSVYPLEDVKVSDGDIGETWLDRNGFKWYFKLNAGPVFYVNLLDGTLEILFFDKTIVSVGNGGLYYAEKNILCFYNPVTHTTNTLGCEFVDAFSNYGGFFAFEHVLSGPDQNRKYFVTKDWKSLSVWNIFVSDNMDSQVLGTAGSVLFVDAPEYPDDGYLPIGRSILAIDTDRGLIISRIVLDEAYFECNITLTVNEHSALLCLYNTDGIVDGFKMWNYENDTTKLNVQAFCLRETSLEKRLLQQEEDVEQLSGFKFGDYDTMYKYAKKTVTDFEPLTSRIEQFIGMMMLTEVFGNFELNRTLADLSDDTELFLIQNSERAYYKVAATAEYPHDIYMVNIDALMAALPLVERK